MDFETPIIFSSHLKRFFGLALCVTVSLSALGAERSSYRFPNPPGPHAVGFKVVEQYDHSRVFRLKTDAVGQPVQGERDRPIQTLIWYPAQASHAAQITLGRYFSLSATEDTFLPSPEAAATRTREAEEAFDGKERMWAVEGAAPTTGPYPLVLYAPSFGSSAYENVDLCEYLASFGYVVIASPSMGAHTRAMTGVGLEGVHAQARDISFLIGFAQTLKQVDMSHIAVAGWSWGGLSNFFAAADDDRITALIALDGSTRYYPKMIEDSKEVNPKSLSLPLLFLTAGDISLEAINKDKVEVSANVLNEMTHSDVFIVRMREMTHGNFSALGQRLAAGSKDRPVSEYSEQEATESYGWMAKYVLTFLDAELKDDPVSAKFLRNPPTMNGVPLHSMVLDFRPATGFPATVQGFAGVVGKRGFIHLNGVYAEARSQNPDFKLSLGDFLTWSEQLVRENHLPEAIEVLKLTISFYPTESWYSYRLLSRAYAANNQKDLAISTLQALLQKDPDNDFGKAYLKELEAGVP
jgi:dienelactone hydrolase